MVVLCHSLIKQLKMIDMHAVECARLDVFQSKNPFNVSILTMRLY